MTREEQLKQEIEKKFENTFSFTLAVGYVNVALSTPSILRNCDPEIMKQSGWVREDSLKEIKRHILNLVEYDKKGHLGCNATEWALSELHRLIK